MNPNVWGPNLWFALHTITLNYPKTPTYENKKAYNILVSNNENVISSKEFKSLQDKFTKLNMGNDNNISKIKTLTN